MKNPRYLISTVYAPDTETKGETFLWYRPMPRLQLGVALLWKQGAFRALGNYELVTEGRSHPNLRVGVGLQGIATGNPGYFVTTEKTWRGEAGNLNMFVGTGWRANEDHAHPLGGFKFSPVNTPFTLGVQWDGHSYHPFMTAYVRDGITVGAYAIEGKKLGLMMSFAF